MGDCWPNQRGRGRAFLRTRGESQGSPVSGTQTLSVDPSWLKLCGTIMPSLYQHSVEARKLMHSRGLQPQQPKATAIMLIYPEWEARSVQCSSQPISGVIWWHISWPRVSQVMLLLTTVLGVINMSHSKKIHKVMSLTPFFTLMNLFSYGETMTERLF